MTINALHSHSTEINVNYFFSFCHCCGLYPQGSFEHHDSKGEHKAHIANLQLSHSIQTMADDWYNAHLNSDFLRDKQIQKNLWWIWQVLKPKFYSVHLNYGINMHIHYYNASV